MFGARGNPNSTTGTADNSDASGMSGRASYAARFGAGNPQGNITTSIEFGSNKKYTGSMTETFGPGSGHGSIKSEEAKTHNFITPNKTSVQSHVEDMDEPNLDAPDERPGTKHIP